MSILIFIPMTLIDALLETWANKREPYRGPYSRRPTKFNI